jgi:cyclic-di-AMP phosphodiesterase PgpH
MEKSAISSPRRLRASLANREIGPKYWLLGAGMFFALTAILSVNLLPPDYAVKSVDLKELAGIALLVLGIITISGLYLYDYRPYAFSRPSLLLLLGLTFVGFTLIAKMFSILATTSASFWGYLIPVAFVGMLISVLFDPHLAIMLVISSSIMVGYATHYNFSYTITALLGGMIAVYSTTGISERAELAKAGVITGFGIGFFAVTAGLLQDTTSAAFINGAIGLANGVFSAVLALGTLPFLERQFGIITPMRLLELSNPSQPLLRRLMTEAPGTYSHSIGVGNLAEAAAEATGANPLLVRVGAYYHDIGKLKRPSFFVENQIEDESRHEKMNPQLSCLVITSHVKDGVDMAKEESLPPPIIELIDQHHGKGVVTFFYHEAKKQKLKEDVCDDTFRYTGDKPRSREAAILMLADAVEAAAKAIKDPSVNKFETLTKRIIQERMDDHQLDESDMTLADLSKVAKTFTQILSGVYHKRVAYPDLEEEDLPNRHKGPKDA